MGRTWENAVISDPYTTCVVHPISSTLGYLELRFGAAIRYLDVASSMS